MEEIQRYIDLLRRTLGTDYSQMYRPASGILKYPFLVPGSLNYGNCLWDWDSYFADVALHRILRLRNADSGEIECALQHGQGCVKNFLNLCVRGHIPINVAPGNTPAELHPEDPRRTNMHKPVLAQHAAFLSRMTGDAEWLRELFPKLLSFLNLYRNHFRQRATGLYFWANDCAIGVDNDPCTFGRPAGSSASILLNSFMVKELEAASMLAGMLHLEELAATLRSDAEETRAAVRKHCYDQWTGFYYSCDLNLTARVPAAGWTHCGMPRDWDCLIQRIGVWSGFLAMWANIASRDEAERMTREHARNEKTFACPWGIRTLSRLEKMYSVRASGNPSNWLGPVWGISNYLVFRGLVRCQQDDAARDLAAKTVRLFGRDLERFGELHEFYLPETGEPVMNRGFQNWNYLVLIMADYLENGTQPVTEF